MTVFYLIRHAEAEGNITRRVHGHFDTRLTPRGIAQARLLSERFRDIELDAVYSSPLYRARKTAETVAEIHGLIPITDIRLRELGMGIWEDLPFAECAALDPEQWNNLNNEFNKFDVEGAETAQGVLSRFSECIDEIALNQRDKTVAVFAHSMVLTIFFTHLLRAEYGDDRTPPHTDNTSVSRITHDGNFYHVDFIGDVSHLPQEMRTTELKRRMSERLGRNCEMRFTEVPSAPGGGNDVTFVSYLGDIETGKIVLSLQPDTGIIKHAEMSPEYRSFGLGAQLIGQASSFFRASGKEKMTARNTGGARSFFERAGFYETAEDELVCNLL